MTKYINIVFGLLLMLYLVIAFWVSAGETTPEGFCSSVSIDVEAAPGAEGFVTAEEIAAELDGFPSHALETELALIDTHLLHRQLLGMDKLEDASVVRYTDGSIRIKVVPIVPVARVFDGPDSYYVNRSGKRVDAGPRFRKNVPLIKGHFSREDTTFTPSSLIPLLDILTHDSIWSSYISMVEVKGPRDIILVPSIREHVINLGDLSDLPLKLERLTKFYNSVLRAQGWEKYDTISLKWRGQIVATKRHRRAADMPISSFDEDETVSVDAMLAADDVAPGQAMPGEKAHSEAPIPGRRP